MAIATPDTTLYSDSVDQLLETVAAKVRAQLDREILSQASESQETESQETESQETECESPSSAGFDADAISAEGLEPQLSELDSEMDSKLDSELDRDDGFDAPTVSFAGVDIRQMAADGYFQAIAYWLNERLVPQNVYAQVLADEVPGRLRILIEFERAPQAERLVRFVCDRLYQLNSDVIEGVHLIVCALGAGKIEWERSVRIPTASERATKKLRQKAQVAQPDAIASTVFESSPSQRARQVMQGQFKFFRAALVCGSAIAAFFFGGVSELIFSHRLSVASLRETRSEIRSETHSETRNQTETPALPWYGEAPALDFSQASEVSFRPASRFKGRTVEAALETVSVIPHNRVADPSDPTVTLLFGGDLSLNDFIFENASDVDQLFSELDIYQKADVAMVGLVEPLAYASTSLQEDFYRRTRPQAAKALDAGGIDIVGLASEGTLLYGERGLDETLDNLDRQGIYRVGAGRTQKEAHRPEILEVKGQRIAYLGYNPDALKGADLDKAGVALPNSDTRKHMVEDIRAIRPQVDWVVVNYRWGDILDAAEDAAEAPSETSETASSATASGLVARIKASAPEDWQKSLAHEAVDAGADLVVGYHPSHIQGTEIYRDRAIAYSLGDVTFDNTAEQNHATSALKVSLRNQQMKVEFLPLTIQDAKLQLATGEQGANILQTIRKTSRTLAEPLRFPAVLKATPTSPDHSVVSPQRNNNASTTENVAPAAQSASPSAPVSDPMMQEPEALFMPKADPDASDPDALDPDALDPDALDRQWQDENLRDRLQDETLLETWGEKQTDSELKFTPIPAGTLERQQLGDEPEHRPAEDPESSVKEFGPEDASSEGSSLEDLGLEGANSEGASLEDQGIEDRDLETFSESELESNISEPWQDPFAESSSPDTVPEDSRAEIPRSESAFTAMPLPEDAPVENIVQALSEEDLDNTPESAAENRAEPIQYPENAEMESQAAQALSSGSMQSVPVE